jgi:hypothetical protein
MEDKVKTKIFADTMIRRCGSTKTIDYDLYLAVLESMEEYANLRLKELESNNLLPG